MEYLDRRVAINDGPTILYAGLMFTLFVLAVTVVLLVLGGWGLRLGARWAWDHTIGNQS